MRDFSITLALDTLEQTQAFGDYLGQTLTPGTVLLLEGDLGSGKTTLVQAIGLGLGITDAIISPTFAIVHEYFEGRVPLYHFDLYRLSSAEAQEMHLELYWSGAEVPLGITAIEWPVRLSQRPQEFIQISLVHAELGRQATITAVGLQSEDLLKKIQLSWAEAV